MLAAMPARRDFDGLQQAQFRAYNPCRPMQPSRATTYSRRIGPAHPPLATRLVQRVMFGTFIAREPVAIGP
jgi:hypothetical protein